MESLPLVYLKTWQDKLVDSEDWGAVEAAIFCALQVGDNQWVNYLLGRLRKKFPGSARVERAAAIVKETVSPDDGAAEAYKQLLQRLPEDPWVRKRLSCVLLRQGRATDALRFLEEQAAIFSADSEIFHQQAMLQLTLFGSIPKCLYLFEEVLLSQPENVYNLVTYGELQCSNGDWEAGRKYFSFALRLKPNDLRALWLLAIALTKCKRQQPEFEVLKELAAETKRKLVAAYPHNSTAALVLDKLVIS